MWLLTGPFDGEVVGDLNFEKTKVLKTGKPYPLGRKDRSLTVNSKKVSHDHCEFTVGAYTPEDVADPSTRPSLQFTNKKDKVVKVGREDEHLGVNPSATLELQDGDAVSVVSGIIVTVKWEPLCCYAQAPRGKSAVSSDTCASLGIHLVPLPDPNVTHHLISTYSSNALLAASLLSACQFVKHEWLSEVVRVAQDDDKSFTLPPLTKFRPAFSPSLPAEHKVFKVWEPNEERLHMFKDIRFLCVGEKAREIDGDLRTVINRGDGAIETFNVHDGRAKWHKALSRGKAKGGKRVVAVADKVTMTVAVGKEEWKELVEETQSFDLHFVNPEEIIRAVMDVDTSIFSAPPQESVEVEQASRSSSPIPDFIPNTLDDEPTHPPPTMAQRPSPEPDPVEEPQPPPRRKLIRRVPSRQASQDPSAAPTPAPESEPDPDAPRPRRALTRRVNAGVPILNGIDDTSMMVNAAALGSTLASGTMASAPPETPMVVDLTAPAAPRSSRLKRRLGVSTEPSATTSGTLDESESAQEPKHKRFKALFEASDPEGPGTPFSQADFLQDGAPSQTQSQSQTQAGNGRSTRSGTGAGTNLQVVREEEEETQSTNLSELEQGSRGTKRKAGSSMDDIEMAGVEDALAPPPPTMSDSGSGPPDRPVLKKRAIAEVNAVERTDGAAHPPQQSQASSSQHPPSADAPASPSKAPKKPGAAPGKPDTDAAFLKALASTKRGKKAEDDFDRDFNKLKISKPDLERGEPEKDWNVLEDFGNEGNLRGNFMVVLEMDISGSSRRYKENGNGGVHMQWQDQPNFKKFKKKTKDLVRPKIDLVATEENDYGIGPAYWKEGKSQSQSQGLSQHPVLIKKQSQSQRRPRAPSSDVEERPIQVLDDSDDDEPVPKSRNSRTNSRANTMKPPSRAGSVTTQKRTTASRSTKSKPTPKTQPLFLDSDEEVDDLIEEDEDIEETLPSTAASTRRPTRAATQKKTTIIVDDDSDDGAVFGGFGGKKKAVKRR